MSAGLPFSSSPPLVADSDAVGVVVAGVSTHLGFWTAGIDHAILRNVIVVTGGVESTGLVAGFQGFYREVLVYTCGTAMYHNQIDFSLILHGFLLRSSLKKHHCTRNQVMQIMDYLDNMEEEYHKSYPDYPCPMEGGYKASFERFVIESIGAEWDM